MDKPEYVGKKPYWKMHNNPEKDERPEEKTQESRNGREPTNNAIAYHPAEYHRNGGTKMERKGCVEEQGLDPPRQALPRGISAGPHGTINSTARGRTGPEMVVTE